MTRRSVDRWTLAAALLLTLPSAAALAQSQATSDVQHLPAQAQSVASPAATTPAATSPASPASRESAKAALRAPDAADLRPSGAVTVTADHAELIQGDYAVYTGKVHVASNTLTMDGDRVELRQVGGGNYTAKVTGAPATLTHAANGTDDPAVTAHAETLDYDSRSHVVTLKGHAQLTRGANIVDGDDIEYDFAQRRVQAAGGDNGQVKMVIQPPPQKPGDGPTETPAP